MYQMALCYHHYHAAWGACKGTRALDLTSILLGAFSPYLVMHSNTSYTYTISKTTNKIQGNRLSINFKCSLLAMHRSVPSRKLYFYINGAYSLKHVGMISSMGSDRSLILWCRKEYRSTVGNVHIRTWHFIEWHRVGCMSIRSTHGKEAMAFGCHDRSSAR